jgi:hypothetical protein
MFFVIRVVLVVFAHSVLNHSSPVLALASLRLMTRLPLNFLYPIVSRFNLNYTGLEVLRVREMVSRISAVFRIRGAVVSRMSVVNGHSRRPQRTHNLP